MSTPELIAAIVGFALAAGYVAVSWLRRGREPTYADDASILVPAPPPGMTAATATIIDGGPTRLAFMAALLDLASRDEIRFRAEGRTGSRTSVGIAIRGGDSADPAVRLNRRQPIGEGETWLLAQLRMSLLADERRHDGADSADLPSPEMLQVGSRMMAALMRAGSTTGDEDDDPAARAAREHGLMQGPGIDPVALAQAYEARTGKPMPDHTRERFEQMAAAMQVFADPAAVARDPDAAVSRLESTVGQTMTPDQVGELRQWAARYAPATPGTSSAAPEEYIPAARATHLAAPLLFGTFLETYALRHGWLGGLPFFKRLRWRLTAVGEVVLGGIAAWLGTSLGADVLVGLGAGLAVGGLATWLVAPAMAVKTHEGAVMKAQLAAYRRTLGLTFAQAQSFDDAAARSGLHWLETPDQALVWGIALGLRTDIEALLARTADAVRLGQPAGGYAPAWFSAPPDVSRALPAAGPGAGVGATPAAAGAALPASLADPAAMFAGIEAIGSQPAQPA